jgi:NADPH:quinone reductase-like Zn-dependent oxidoreductase
MKAVQLIAYGDAAEGLRLCEIDEPGAPGPDEALVATLFAPINFNDLMVAWGIYAWKPELPETLGNEGMGRVIAVGAGVSQVQPGDLVVLPFMARTWREQLIVPAASLVVLPAGADPHQAAMIAINGATVAMLLDDFVDLRPGDAVVYNAAGSGLGHWVAVLAKRRGLRTIGLIRRSADAKKVRASGCEVVIADDEDASVIAPRIAGLTVRLALDGVGGPAVDRLLQCLGERGTLVAYAAASGQPMHVSAQHLIFKRIRVEGFFEGHPDRSARIVPLLRDLVHLIGADGVAQPVAAVYPLSALKEAVAHAVGGGKVLLSFSS